jgi:hypothetical protein
MTSLSTQHPFFLRLLLYSGLKDSSFPHKMRGVVIVISSGSALSMAVGRSPHLWPEINILCIFKMSTALFVHHSVVQNI